MLQPLQLKEVSARYPHEIAELQDFLLKADCVTGTDESLHAIVTRLQRDRAFHRDLISHLWVVIHLSQGKISYAELLGALAIAASGTRLASQAHEDDAHALLRFVMEARQSLDGAGKPEKVSGAHAQLSLVAPPLRLVQPEPVRDVVREAVREAFRESAIREPVREPAREPVRESFRQMDREPEIIHTRSRSVAVDPPYDEADHGRRPLWIAACMLAALAIGLGWHYRDTLRGFASSYTVAGTVAPVPATPAASVATTTPAPQSEAAPAPAPVVVTPPATPGKSKHAKPVHAETRNPHKPAATKPSVPAHAPAQPPVVAAVAPAKAPPVKAPPVVSGPSVPPPAATPKNSPASASAVHVGVPYSSTGSSAPDLTNSYRRSQTPHLERRTPEERGELIAENHPLATVNGKGTPGATPGIVHATSLGVNASRVVYSPTPSYPASASAAHVQGEVKLEASVDSQGNVVSVRVISGPPMLREAALDAAQRWRYRPNMADGEPTAMSAITVFAFQLP